jgi:hypothetical protein
MLGQLQLAQFNYDLLNKAIYFKLTNQTLLGYQDSSVAGNGGKLSHMYLLYKHCTWVDILESPGN